MSKMVVLTAFVLSLSITVVVHAQTDVITVEEYNEKLPVWGTSWDAGSNSISGYYPTFYTGFAPRQQAPNRIHIRLSRGNQTRVSIILDEKTVMDYVYDLQARSDFYTKMTSHGYINISPRKSDLTPHVEYFSSVVANSDVPSIISAFKSGQDSKEALYQKSLEQLKKFNSHRIFDINLNLSKELLAWRDEALSSANAEIGKQEAMTLVNLMLWARVNTIRSLTDTETAGLQNLKNKASVLSEEGFVFEAVKLLKSVTDDKYDFKVLEKTTMKFVDALNCLSLDSCTLNYTELSSIYPTGSYEGSTRDDNGNRINLYATVGVNAFLDGGSRGDVDHIRKEQYYGFAPKMDYEDLGNGYHNPAVRLWPNRSTKEVLKINSGHSALWSVKRGRVSSGCARLPSGHIWELRNTMPVQNALVKNVYWFGNDSRDFDLYDIDADGTREIMGVKYYIQYDLTGSTGLAKREGEGLKLNDNVLEYYEDLYGSRGVYTLADASLVFHNPSISIHTASDIWGSGRSPKKVVSRKTVQGDFKLYEQPYEQDKIQFYTSDKIRSFNRGLSGGGKESLSKRFVRLMGRVKGCAPFSDKEECGSNAFEKEMSGILREIN
ncbi:MAG: hypothetical protein ACRBBP_05065 [Bdellovibrionales bacterium]